MKILVIDEEFPFPTNTGKRIRSFNLIKRLGKHHRVTYLAYGSEKSDSYQALADAGLEPLPVARKLPPKSGLAFYGRLFANLFSPYPYSVASHYSLAFQAALRRELVKGEYDLLLCEWSPYARFAEDIGGVTTVAVAHNIEAQIWNRYRQNESDSLKRWYIGRQAEKMDRFENSVYRRVDGATAVSEPDAELINKINPDLPVTVIENGVDLDFFTADFDPRVLFSPKLVFTGSMDWRPNQDAAIYFVNEIMPVLLKKYEDLQLYLVGRNPSAAVRALGERPGVTVTGTVDDVRPYIAESAVYVVPLRIGGGSRLKILEALAMKRPVVSTTVGAEGLEVTDGEDILLADTPQRFAESVDELFDNPDLAGKLGEKGRQLVEARYGWDYLAEKLTLFLENLVRSK